MSNNRGKRYVREYNFRLSGKPDDTFPLFSPEKEMEWLDGWSYEMIYSQTGSVELGCTVKANFIGECYLTVTKYVPSVEIEYFQFIIGMMIIVLNIKLSEVEGDTLVEIILTYTSLTEQGNEFISNQAELQSKTALEIMERSLQHFIATGQKLQNDLF